MALRPAGCVLIELRDAVEHCLAKGMADELQGERQIAIAEACRNNQAGLAGDVERHAGLAPVIRGERLVIFDAAGGIHARGGYRRADICKCRRYPVAKLEAPAYRLEVVDSAERRPGEEPLARPRAIILWPLLEPLLVDGIGFDGEDDLAAGAEILQGRQGDFADFRACFGEEFDRGVEGLDLFGIAGDIFGVEMADDADPQASDILAEQRPVVGYRLVRASRITRIMPGDHLEHQRVVAHRAGHRPDMVEGEGERRYAAAADPAIGGLHAGGAAHRGWIADRAAGVGAECRREEAGGKAGAAAARRAAAEMIAVPRVARRRPGQVEGRAADR